MAAPAIGCSSSTRRVAAAAGHGVMAQSAIVPSYDPITGQVVGTVVAPAVP